MRSMILIAALAAFVLPAVAQVAPTTNTSAPPAAGMAEADVIVVPVWPKAALPLPEQPVQASFGLGQIEGVPAHLVAGVTAKGYARKVAAGGRTIGQVLVMSVVRGEREEVISAEGLVTQFDAAETSELFPETNLEVKGSKTALVAALERLAAEKEKDGEEERKTGDSATDNPVSGGSGGTSNNDAAGYRVPTVQPAAEDDTEEPRLEVRSSRDGCSVRIDMAQDKVFAQSKVQTLSDGALTSETACEDSEVSYPLVKTYADCAEAIDAASLTVRRQFRYSWTDHAGAAHLVGACTPDPEPSAVVTLQRDYLACSPSFDASAGTRTELYRSYYLDAAGAKKFVGECLPDAERIATLSKTYAGCAEVIDAASLTVRRQFKYTSVDATGRPVDVGGCQPDPEPSAVVALQRDYLACSPSFDASAGTRTDQYRSYFLDAAGAKKFVGECVPDAERVTTLSKSYAGCAEAIDAASLTVRRQFKYTSVDAAGRPVDVGVCQPDPEPSALVALERDYAACQPEVDGVAGTMYRTYQLHFTNHSGSKQTVGGCQVDAAEKIALDKTYAGCAETVNTASKEVRRQYRYLWIDRAGASHMVGECRPDPEPSAVVTLQRDYAACDPIVDAAAGTLQPAFREYFMDGAGAKKNVSDCQPDPAEKRPLEKTYAGCAEAIDTNNMTVRRQFRYSWTDRTGGAHTVGTCSPDPEPSALVALERDYAACDPLVDGTAGTIQRVYQLHFKGQDGAKKTIGSCTPDSADTAPLTKSYAGCAEAIDTANLIVRRQFRYSWTDRAGNPKTAGECRPDTEPSAIVALERDYAACDPVVNSVAGTMQRAYQLHFKAQDGARKTVGACTPDAAENIPLTRSAEGCTEVVQGDTVRRQTRWTYIDKAGTTKTVGSCAPDTRPEGLVPVQLDPAACDPIIDGTAGTRRNQVRPYYVDGGGAKKFIGDCRPDEAAPITLEKTYAGCAEAIDAAGLTVRRQFRYSWIGRDGRQQTAGDCRPDTTSAGVVQLSKDFSGCEPAIDHNAAKATPAYRLTYIDGTGTQRNLGACTPDAGQVIQLSRDYAACDPTVDNTTKKVLPNYRLYFLGSSGEKKNVGDCRPDPDGEVDLKKSYGSCPPDIVDIRSMKAWPQYILYYTDAAGDNHEVGDCVKDNETLYTITEDDGQCPIYLDFAAKKAVPQSIYTYVNQYGATVQARGCEPSNTTAPLPMTETTAACPLRHDFHAGRSHQLSMWTYTRDGVTYQAAPCTDSGRTFVHETVHADATGSYICPVITNMTTKKATLQGRKRITVNGVPQFVTECAPDTTQQSILSTTNGCMDVSKWMHDLNAGVSYGQRRWYYNRADGSPEYVTDCESSTATYTHQEQIVGWQYRDNQLWAWPLSTVTIRVSGTTHTVASSQVLPGAPQVSYVREGTVDRPIDRHTYEDCNAYRQTERYERWSRPDGTEYLKPVGAGTPEAPRNACTYLASWTFDSHVVNPGTNPELGDSFYICLYSGTRVARREDGATISTSTHTHDPRSISLGVTLVAQPLVFGPGLLNMPIGMMCPFTAQSSSKYWPAFNSFKGW